MMSSYCLLFSYACVFFFSFFSICIIFLFSPVTPQSYTFCFHLFLKSHKMDQKRMMFASPFIFLSIISSDFQCSAAE